MKAVNDYGMDAQLAAKRQANYDTVLEERITQWIERTCNITRDKEFGPWLQDGTVLLTLTNTLVPDANLKVKTKGKWGERENISSFIKYARQIGVNEASLFPTESLAELKDLQQVMITISAFSKKVQQKASLLKSPIAQDSFLDKPTAAGDKPKKKWVVKPGGSSAPSLLMAGSSNTMQKTKYSDGREAIKRKQLDGSGTGGGVSMLNAGSAGIMEKSTYSDGREAIKRNQLDGTGTGGGMSMLNAGSAGIMEKSTYSDGREAIKRNQLDGTGTGGGMSMLNAGSAGVMEKTTYSDGREAIKRNQLDGTGTGGGMSMLNAGSAGVMEKSTYSNGREAIKEGKL
eukprot:CAMPEP_0184042634 /NCGR_PEP_ID=MMETSP0955-20130417/66452_1 /TAXON_ID=627963 /ORGANISM="Aplanochytrium sp, Strain PBS07" /LENGTH=342 /DNA_ID=CAMNT_0026333421 /DNA_START=134 /DNA_END=1162 /DNA_ORIENTATION=+